MRRYHVPWHELPAIVREDIVTSWIVFSIVSFLIGVVVGAVLERYLG